VLKYPFQFQSNFCLVSCFVFAELL
jgi:hypothetical protein